MEVPLCYDEEFGLGLEFVCKHNQISKAELISLHTKPYYLVFMLGFMAGFPYLGGLDERLSFLKAGMFLKFKAISKDEFFEIQEQVAKKIYQKEIYEYKNH